MEQSESVRSGQFLTFKLDNEMFSLDVSHVQEVLDMLPVTKLPAAPDFVKGIINVRGNMVPVMDLRKKFGLSELDASQDTRIIVFDVNQNGETMTLGALADSVHEVSDFDLNKIEPPPKIARRWRSDFIHGIAKKNDQFFMILDINKVFTEEELAMTAETA